MTNLIKPCIGKLEFYYLFLLVYILNRDFIFLVLACLFGLAYAFTDTTQSLPLETTQSSSEEMIITGIPFDCTGKPTGFYKDNNYCDIFHVCVSFQQKKTYGCPQIGDQFFYDEKLKMYTSNNCINSK